MRILSRYFALRFLSLFAAILFISTLAIVVVEMLLNFDDLLQNDAGVASAAAFIFLRVPSYYLRDLVPIAVFAAAFFAVGLAGHWLEMTAIRAGGISAHRAALPVLAAASIVAGCSLLVNETLVIHATEEWNRHLRGGSRSISFRRGTFWYHRGRTIYNITAANRTENTLRGVRLFELDARGRLIRSIQSPLVRVQDGNSWRLERATIRHFEPQRPGGAPHVEHVTQTVIDVADESSSALMDADASTLTLPDLRDYVARRKLEGEPALRAEALYYTRLTEPLVVLLFALLALPLALRVETARNLAAPAVYGLATVGCFFALRGAAGTLAAEGVISAALGESSVLLLFGGLAVWQLQRTQ